MTMTTPTMELHLPVESVDEVSAAIESARLHIEAFYAADRATLIDSFSSEELIAWDGSAEIALVLDVDGLDVPDEIDCDMAA